MHKMNAIVKRKSTKISAVDFLLMPLIFF